MLIKQAAIRSNVTWQVLIKQTATRSDVTWQVLIKQTASWRPATDNCSLGQLPVGELQLLTETMTNGELQLLTETMTNGELQLLTETTTSWTDASLICLRSFVFMFCSLEVQSSIKVGDASNSVSLHMGTELLPHVSQLCGVRTLSNLTAGSLSRLTRTLNKLTTETQSFKLAN